MKKILNICILVILCFSFQIIVVNASTNTNERTKDNNYLVSSNIKVTDSNLNNVLETPAINSKEKVYDFADLFTDEEENDLYMKVNEYIENYKLDLAIVTINTNNKSSAMEYADDFYDYNDFGINETKDGILFLIDMYTRQIYMSTTGNAIIMYDDDRINDALDAVYTSMTDKNYYEGTLNYIEKISYYALDGIPSSNKGAYLDKNGNIKIDKIVPWNRLLLITLGVTILIISIMISKNRLVRKATTAKEYLKKDTVKINNEGDILISSNTIKHKIEIISDSSSGSGSIGGSSTHSSSSGSSHGGGGHSF